MNHARQPRPGDVERRLRPLLAGPFAPPRIGFAVGVHVAVLTVLTVAIHDRKMTPCDFFGHLQVCPNAVSFEACCFSATAPLPGRTLTSQHNGSAFQFVLGDNSTSGNNAGSGTSPVPQHNLTHTCLPRIGAGCQLNLCRCKWKMPVQLIPPRQAAVPKCKTPSEFVRLPTFAHRAGNSVGTPFHQRATGTRQRVLAVVRTHPQ